MSDWSKYRSSANRQDLDFEHINASYGRAVGTLKGWMEERCVRSADERGVGPSFYRVLRGEEGDAIIAAQRERAEYNMRFGAYGDLPQSTFTPWAVLRPKNPEE